MGQIRRAFAVLWLLPIVVSAGGQSKAVTMLTWQDQYAPCGSGVACSWVQDAQQGARTVDRDVSLTHLAIHTSQVPAETIVIETCLYLMRGGAPTYPWMTAGYSELSCWHATRYAGQADWSLDLDLSAFPLFLPAQTSLICASVLYGGVVVDAQVVCSATIQTYHASDPRYRMLRFPYNDQGPEADGSLSVSPYGSTALSPLHVAAVHLFQGFAGENAPGVLSNACLRWQGSAACFPDQVYTTTQNYESPKVPVPVAWTLPAGDVLLATGQQSRLNTDAAFYAFVEIPAALRVTPENVVRDYGNLDPVLLAQWAAAHLAQLTHPYYCNYQSPCAEAMMIASFLALFPSASCLATDDCLKRGR
jgi:hypothetical protein